MRETVATLIPEVNLFYKQNYVILQYVYNHWRDCLRKDLCS